MRTFKFGYMIAKAVDTATIPSFANSDKGHGFPVLFKPLAGQVPVNQDGQACITAGPALRSEVTFPAIYIVMWEEKVYTNRDGVETVGINLTVAERATPEYYLGKSTSQVDVFNGSLEAFKALKQTEKAPETN